MAEVQRVAKVELGGSTQIPISTASAPSTKTTAVSRKAVTNSRNCRIKQEQTPSWSTFNELIEIRKKLTNNTQNNNNNNNNNNKSNDNYNTYPLGDGRPSQGIFGQSACDTSDAECLIGCRSTTKANKDDINRSRSISMVHQRGSCASSAIPSSISHCLNNNQTHSHLTHHQPPKTSRAHLLSTNCRGRSKTVSVNANCASSQLIGQNNNNNPLTSISTADAKSGRQAATITDIDRLNGNACTNLDVLGSGGRVVVNQTRRIIGIRNRSRTTINDTKCTHLQPNASKLSNCSNTVPSVKRGKRTLSSTQIEREKSDEKIIKVLKKKQIQNS